jgi:hypothetical protein
MVFLFYRNGEAAADRLTFTISRIGGAQGSHLLNIAGTQCVLWCMAFLAQRFFRVC